MKKSTMTRSVVLSALGFLIVGFILSPSVAIVGGTTFGTAGTVTEGIYQMEMVVYPTTTTMYYKVSCEAGDILYVALYAPDSYDRKLYILDASQTQLCANTTLGTTLGVNWVADCQITCPSAGWYYIRVHTDDSVPGAYFYNLIVMITAGEQGGIPGFELLYVFFAFIILAGIAVFYKNRNKI